MSSKAEVLTEEVRVYLTRRAIKRLVGMLKTQAVFMESQTWPGYDKAAESAHRAFWRWVEAEIARLPRNARGSLKRWLQRQPDFSRFNWATVPQDMRTLLPQPMPEKQLWIAEFIRQETLVRVAQFSLFMNSAARQEPDLFAAFAPDMWSAEQTGLKSFFHLLAKTRRLTKFKSDNDRMLKYQLMSLWIPACFWAISTGRISKTIEDLYPRGGEYKERVVARQVHALGLWRLPKPRKLEPPN